MQSSAYICLHSYSAWKGLIIIILRLYLILCWERVQKDLLKCENKNGNVVDPWGVEIIRILFPSPFFLFSSLFNSAK